MPLNIKQQMLNLIKATALKPVKDNANAKIKARPSTLRGDAGVNRRPTYSFDELVMAWGDYGKPTTQQDMTDFLLSLHLTKSEVREILDTVGKIKSPTVSAILDVVSTYKLHEYVANILINDFKISASKDFKDTVSLSKEEIIKCLAYLLSNDREAANFVKSQPTESKLYRGVALFEGKGISPQAYLDIEVQALIKQRKLPLKEYCLASALMIYYNMNWDTYQIRPVVYEDHVDLMSQEHYTCMQVIKEIMTTHGRPRIQN